MIRKRQAESIAAEQVQGVRFGHPVKISLENFGNLVKQWRRGNLAIQEILTQTGLKEATFYRRLRELRLTKRK